MSGFTTHLQMLDTSALRTLHRILAREMFEAVDLGNKPYNTPSQEQKIRDEINDKTHKLEQVNQELRNREKRSKMTAPSVSKKRKATKTPSK